MRPISRKGEGLELLNQSLVASQAGPQSNMLVTRTLSALLTQFVVSTDIDWNTRTNQMMGSRLAFAQRKVIH